MEPMIDPENHPEFDDAIREAVTTHFDEVNIAIKGYLVIECIDEGDDIVNLRTIPIGTIKSWETMGYGAALQAIGARDLTDEE